MFCYEWNWPWILGIALVGVLWGWYVAYDKYKKQQASLVEHWKEKMELRRFYKEMVGEDAIFQGEGELRSLMWNYREKRPGRPDVDK